MELKQPLQRLSSVWVNPAIYFITTCADGRRPLLADPAIFEILRSELAAAHERHGWRIGRFVVMPDHLHFFCTSTQSAHAASLSGFVGRMKQWSAKAIIQLDGCTAPVWQKQFFDHVLRSAESYDNKWRYVMANPARAGLVAKAEDWPYAGEIEPLEWT